MLLEIAKKNRSETILDKNPVYLVNCTDIEVSVDGTDFQMNIPIRGYRIESYTHRLVLHLVCIYLDCEFSPVEVDRRYILGFIEIEQDLVFQYVLIPLPLKNVVNHPCIVVVVSLKLVICGICHNITYFRN